MMRTDVTRLVSLDVFRGLTMAGDGDRQQPGGLGQRLLARCCTPSGTAGRPPT